MRNILKLKLWVKESPKQFKVTARKRRTYNNLCLSRQFIVFDKIKDNSIYLYNLAQYLSNL